MDLIIKLKKRKLMGTFDHFPTLLFKIMAIRRKRNGKDIKILININFLLYFIV